MGRGVAPSEIPGISKQVLSDFGHFAEELIWADFCAQNPSARASGSLFRDDHNPAAYTYFLTTKNKQFGIALQKDLHGRLRRHHMFYIPDFLIHTRTERAFYEIKPWSKSGLEAGAQKVGNLSAAYKYYRLPYVAGHVFNPRDHVVAHVPGLLKVKLLVRRAVPGLVVYSLDLECGETVELAVRLALLAFIAAKLAAMKKLRVFKPIDLSNVLAHRSIAQFATDMGLVAASGAGATIGYRYFWKAVMKKYAARITASGVLMAADGPLPVGDLIAAGLNLFTVVQIIRDSRELWMEARRIKANEI